MQRQIHPRSAAKPIGETGAARALEIVVTALLIYLAISIGVMQMKAGPAPMLHSASGQAETVHI